MGPLPFAFRAAVNHASRYRKPEPRARIAKVCEASLKER
jgi:hypothetical protein